MKKEKYYAIRGYLNTQQRFLIKDISHIPTVKTKKTFNFRTSKEVQFNGCTLKTTVSLLII